MAGGVPVEVREPRGRSRDHTERMLRAFGYEIEDDGEWIRFAPTGRIVRRCRTRVPGDPSSAAFLVGAALLAEGGAAATPRRSGLNPTRTGFLRVLARMGAEVAVEDCTTSGGEPVGDLIVRPAEPRAPPTWPPARFPG